MASTQKRNSNSGGERRSASGSSQNGGKRAPSQSKALSLIHI